MPRLPVADKYAQPEVVDFWRDFSRQGLQACEAIMLERYAPPPACVLDLGCGSGRAGLALIPQGYDVTGLDLIGEMVASAQALHREAGLPTKFVQADLRAIPAREASYDIVLILIAALQHISGRAARRQAFAEMRRVLRPRGVLILALDNLAPALTCYAWWAWRKLGTALWLRNAGQGAGERPAHFARGDSRGGRGEGTAADAMLEARRGQAGALAWHLRGLARTLRWRTWPGLLDGLRRLRLLPGEPGDVEINQVSLTPTSGMVYYHLYRHAELIADAASSGFSLFGYHSGRELNEGQTFAPLVRQLDKQVLYAFQKTSP